jgi:RHS repeat-associated protein
MISTSGYEHYQYGAGGELVKRFSRSGSEFYSNVEIDGLFQYNNRLNVATEHQNKINVLDSSGNTIAQRRLGSAMGEASYTSDELYMLHNHTGSIIGTYDLNGAQQEGEDYYPFGETAHNWNGNKTHRFGGKLRSFSSGFYLFGARQYIPWLAKFTSVDPLAAKSTDRNPYHYASNNPINRTDPTGMSDGKGDGKGGANPKSSNEPKGKVINAHGAKVEAAKSKLAEKQTAVDNLKSNPIKKGSEGYDAYKTEFDAAKTELNSAKSELRSEQNNFNLVEKMLNEFAWNDPKSYKNMIDIAKQRNIDVYVGIDPKLKIEREIIDGGGISIKGTAGTLDALTQKETIFTKNNSTGEILTTKDIYHVSSREMEEGSVRINLAFNTTSITVAHEYGHFLQQIGNMESDISWKEGNIVQNDRHGSDDPSHDAAKDAEMNYKNLLKTNRPMPIGFVRPN